MQYPVAAPRPEFGGRGRRPAVSKVAVAPQGDIEEEPMDMEGENPMAGETGERDGERREKRSESQAYGGGEPDGW